MPPALFSPDGRLLVTGYLGPNGCALHLWRSADGTRVGTIECRGVVNWTAFSADGALLLIEDGVSPRRLRLWRTADSTECELRYPEVAGTKGCATFSPDGLLVAIATDRGVIVWRTADGAHHVTLKARRQSKFTCLAFSPDSGLLAAGHGDDERVRIWRTVDAAPHATLKGHKGGVRVVTFSPDGRLLATGPTPQRGIAPIGDDTVRLWQSANGARHGTVSSGTGGLVFVRFSPDGRLLSTSSCGDPVRSWRTADCRLEATLAGHSGVGVVVVFSPDGGLVVTMGTDDMSARLWRTTDGPYSTVLDLAAEGDQICQQLGFSPDGVLLAISTDQGSSCGTSGKASFASLRTTEPRRKYCSTKHATITWSSRHGRDRGWS